MPNRLEVFARADAGLAPAGCSSRAGSQRRALLAAGMVRIAAVIGGREVCADLSFTTHRALLVGRVSKRGRVVITAMCAIGRQCQILWGVIQSVAIEVMHLFCRAERPADLLREYDAMFECLLPARLRANPNLAVAVRSHITTAVLGHVSLCLDSAYTQGNTA